MVCSSRTILRHSLKNRIVPYYNFLKNLLKDDKKAALMLKRAACVRDFHNTAASCISLLQRHGVPHLSILRLLRHDVAVLFFKAEKFDEFVKMLSGMGFDPLDKNFILALRVVSGLSGESWERKMKAFKEWGLSKDEILLAFRRFPPFMALSEENISRKIEFLVTKMGWDPAAVVKVPCVLVHSMEKRIIPRCSVIQALLFKGLIKEKPPLSSFLIPIDKLFLERFVNRYQEQEPQLLDIFKEKMKVSDLGIGFEGLYELTPL
ncbi:hypothetical protein HS088_TW08G00756 [Tripterygium wilfordii]|uniref:Mitochondrial transcription termination factor family protein n=2 Tax=Tripterygium wilfordii TaxID=458696 RepID=A0A7J7DCS1_TRIWF|nr:hypothetical protein HS088_TW08G00756 [Tripterygium wilfordii]